MHDLSAFTMITNDSRAVKAGAIFAALPGVISDGRSYIDAAIKSGATYVLAPIGTPKPQVDITWQESADIRKDYAVLCAAFHNAQPEHIVAVTGTNGKSSVVSFARQLWGEESVSLGTIGLQGAGMDEPAALTTLDPAVLHEILARCAKNGVKKLALEASSHGLEQERLAGVKIKAAAFTNISHDHLDYHKTMDVYLQAKLRVFDQMEAGAPAVINADLPQSAEIIAYAEARALQVLTFGTQAKTLKIIEAQPVFNGINAVIEVNGQRKEFLLPLLGSFQLYNALAALALSYPDALLENIDRLQDLTPVHGRMDKIEGHPKGAQVFVDYAHTPDALETVLKALKPHVAEGGRLIALIGCGGDRDSGKRAPMARISGALADHVIVTDDNPRSEDPALIRKDVLAGFPAAEEIGGRSLAIKAAVKMLDAKDILLVAGKGHEQGQTIGTIVTPFDDSNEVIKAYKEAKI
jgi:UDP-N-acetylmuramoyl-L-alanyl-D-glutamate--2,6-diaminopimelate ligase